MRWWRRTHAYKAVEHGSTLTRSFFHAQFPESVTSRNLSINDIELLTVVVAAKVGGKLWRGLRIVIQCDNETSVTVLNTGKTHNSFLQGCLRELELVAARFETRSEQCILRAWITAFLTLLAAGKLVGSRDSTSANWLLEWWWRRNSCIKDCSSLCMTGRVGKWELFGCR